MSDTTGARSYQGYERYPARTGYRIVGKSQRGTYEEFGDLDTMLYLARYWESLGTMSYTIYEGGPHTQNKWVPFPAEGVIE